MKNKVLIFGAIAAAVVLFIKNKQKAFDLSTIKLEAFKIKGFNGTTLSSLLTISIQNPTSTPLEFNSITGKVLEKNNEISTFSRILRTEIPAHSSQKFDIAVDISVASLVSSALDLIANGLDTNFTIDSVTNVSGINIPVRQIFNVNFAKATNEAIVEVKDDTIPDSTDVGTIDVPGVIINETPTLVAPQILDPVVSTPQVLTINYNGGIDPNGGVVMTLLPPSDSLFATTVEPSQPFVALDQSIYLNPAYSGVITTNI